MRTTTKLLQIGEKLRNIGILAHIDAGKTTTTERMLYYSGTIRSMGEVHHGNTVTDYMEQERQRGITITAAAVSFDWKDYEFNLIDTPGHIDFTMEVEQSLGVLDGGVVILDGSAGVEAQTLTVWRQCDTYNLPRLTFINKMDRNDSNIDMCLKSMRYKLETTPICLQIPIKDESGKLKGVIDLVNLDAIYWDLQNSGRKFIRQKLSENTHGVIWEKAMDARRNLTDTLSEHDDELADIIIKSETLDNISPSSLEIAIRKTTLGLKTFPVLCGSSYKNVGVQTLMDAIVNYLPSPLERNFYYKCFGNDLCGKAFKVQHDDQKGVLTFVRMFSGKITKGQKIYNIAKDKSEQGGHIYVPHADEFRSVTEVQSGNVAVISGLKVTASGDIFTSSHTSANAAQKKLSEELSVPEKMDKLSIPPYIMNKISSTNISKNFDESASKILGIGTTIPEPVFLCSIEPPSMAYQTALEKALEELQREDPSLRVTYHADTGQTVMAGMGELHLEIIKERIRTEYKIDAEIGSFQIAYKECLNSSLKETHVIDSKIGSTKQYVKITLSAYPSDSKEILSFDNTHDSASNISHIYSKHLAAIKLGIQSSLCNGPNMGCPLINVGVKLHWLEVTRGTSDTFVAAATTQCLRKIFRECESSLLEPIMYMEIVLPEEYSSRVLNDLTKRRSNIQQINLRGKNKVIECFTPLSELLGYSTDLRCLSSGTSTFTMEFHSNQPMSPLERDKAITSIRGF